MNSSNEDMVAESETNPTGASTSDNYPNVTVKVEQSPQQQRAHPNSAELIPEEQQLRRPHDDYNQPTNQDIRPTNNNIGQHPKPDFGNDFVPGAGPARYAPKALDHFQRGHDERSTYRDRNHDHRPERTPGRGGHYNNNSNYHGRGGYGGGGGGGGGGYNNNNNHYNPGGRGNHYDRGDRNSNNNYSGDRPRFSGSNNNSDDPWSQQHRENRPTILQGLDINALVDRLTSKLNNKAALFADLDRTRIENRSVFDSGKALTALISIAARRKNIGLGHAAWDWMDHAGIAKNTFHYNSMISVTEKARDYQHALALLQEMKERNIKKNEVTFSSAISACEKCGMWQKAMHLLDTMVDEGVPRTAIAFNATISACEKGMVPQKACEVFHRMKREGIAPSVVSYSALISAAEKGGQWRLALEILEEMKAEGFRGNVVAYSAAISALAKGQQWRKALQLFREIQSQRGTPSIVTYNATMTALEKGMEWERALDLFEEMKMNNLPITVVSYGSAISACDKGFQFRQCLEFLDEMTEMGIPKNVIIFGAAMSCMEKCSRADIGFQLMKRMKEEGIAPNVHIYNSAISACARSNLWEKGFELYEEMEREGVKRDVVTFNAVLDAVCSQIPLGRRLFEVGVERGFYAKVSRLGEQWFELDLHFLSLGGGEIALGWWFEECLVPYLSDTDKLNSVKSISIVTGYGKTRTRGRRNGDDGMRKRCRAMLRFMGITEQEQPNLGRIHIDKDSLIELVKKNGGRIIFDLDGYLQWKDEETRANAPPDVEQKIRARFKPTIAGSGGPPFTRVESEFTSDEYRLENHEARLAKLRAQDLQNESELNGDADYVSRDSDKLHRRTEDQIGRVGGGRDVIGRGVSTEERDFYLSDADKFATGQPHREDKRLYGNDTDASHPVIDSGRNFHRETTNMPEHRNNSQGHFNRVNDRDVNRYSEQRLNSFSHQQYEEDLGNTVNGTHRFDQSKEFDQRLGGRFEQPGRGRDSRDHHYDNVNVAGYQRVDGDSGVAQSHHAAVRHASQQRQHVDQFGERSIGFRDIAVEEPGRDHVHYQDETKFMDTRQHDHEDLRNNAFVRGFQGPRESWRHNEHPNSHQFPQEKMSEMDQKGLRGREDERAHIEQNAFAYEQRNNRGRGDDSSLRGASYPQNQRLSGLSSNFEGVDSLQQYREEDARNVSQEMLRKRQYTEASSQGPHLENQGDRMPALNTSRGYTLEPETQRRRLS